MIDDTYLWKCKSCNDIVIDAILDDTISPEAFHDLVDSMREDHTAYHLSFEEMVG